MSFIFDGNETADQRQARKQKAVSQALQSAATQQPTDMGSGLSALGAALAFRAQQGAAPSAGAQAAQGAGWDGFGAMSPEQQAAATDPKRLSALGAVRSFFGMGG